MDHVNEHMAALLFVLLIIALFVAWVCVLGWRTKREMKRLEAQACGSSLGSGVAGIRLALSRDFCRLVKSCFASLLVVLLPACATVNKALDAGGEVAMKMHRGWCSTPPHRTLALGVDINGRLRSERGAILVCCGDDERPVCNAAREYYADLLDGVKRR